MSSKLDAALALAADGFWLFPLKPEQKKPAHKGWQAEATRDPEQLRAWFGDFNIGIFTGRFEDAGALLVVDVDQKEGKDGTAEIFRLELDGFDLPTTRVHHTPTGGRHLFYRVDEALKQGANVLGRGLDIRSRGGFVVGPGSSTKDGEYRSAGGDVVDTPRWLADRCHIRESKRRDRDSRSVDVDRDRAIQRAKEYLATAPLAVEGNGGDETTYKVAARLKDLGLELLDAVNAMLLHWNERCSPPWQHFDLVAKVENAYRYGTLAPGAAAPEADFKKVEAPVRAGASGEVVVTSNENENIAHPLDELNKEFAYVIAGGGDHILWETTDHDGRNVLRHLPIASFHRKLAARKIQWGKKQEPVTEAWMEWDGRRSFDGLVFMPEMPSPGRFYNLWRGFAVEPWPIDGPLAPKEARAAVDMWVDHITENICQGSVELARWLIGYFAHLIQRPWEKPLVALVFRGPKGTGKNAAVERVADLLGGHALIASNRRYLVGNFNGHLENCLLFVLDEAVWAGDKQGEGVLKDLITGKNHVIEHKGDEPYTVANRTRVAIIGNEDWIVPASYDERRFAVFEVGSGRQQDRAFFQAMREGMECGGSRLLLSYLQRIPLEGIDINAAPNTKALLDQKHATLDTFSQWWLECLTEGRIAASDFEGWPESVETERFRAAYQRYVKDRRAKTWLQSTVAIGKALAKMAPGIHRTRAKANGPWLYKLPRLADCRAAWDRFINHAVEWSAE